MYLVGNLPTEYLKRKKKEVCLFLFRIVPKWSQTCLFNLQFFTSDKKFRLHFFTIIGSFFLERGHFKSESG